MLKAVRLSDARRSIWSRVYSVLAPIRPAKFLNHLCLNLFDSDLPCIRKSCHHILAGCSKSKGEFITLCLNDNFSVKVPYVHTDIYAGVPVPVQSSSVQFPWSSEL